MASQYLCIQCDKTFEPEDTERPRCPTCLRTTSLEPVQASAAVPAMGSVKRGVLFGLVGSAVLIGGYALWALSQPAQVSGAAKVGVLAEREVLGYLAAAEVPAEPIARYLRVSAGVREFAEATAQDGSAKEKAARVAAHFAERAKRGAYVRAGFTEDRAAPLLKPADVAALLKKDGGHARLYPLEVALLATLALREAGVTAVVAEVFEAKDLRAPLDPTGRFGYFGVAVFDGDEATGTPTTFDPFGGIESQRLMGTRLLTDIQVLGAVRAHQAAWLQRDAGKVEEALRAAAEAVRLDKQSPAVRLVHGSVLSYSGAGPAALEELTAAVGLRSDPPRRLVKAQVMLSQGDAAGAEAEIEGALEAAPDFADALVLRAQVKLAKRDVEGARADVDAAARIAPGLASVALARADLALLAGDGDGAARYAEAASKRAAHNWQVRMKTAWIFRATGRYAEMQREAKLVLAQVPEPQKDSMRKTLAQVLGPAALDEEATPPPAPTADGGAGDTAAGPAAGEAAGEMQLEGSGSLLGGKRQGGPSLLGGDSKLELNLGGR